MDMSRAEKGPQYQPKGIEKMLRVALVGGLALAACAPGEIEARVSEPVPMSEPMPPEPSPGDESTPSQSSEAPAEEIAPFPDELRETLASWVEAQENYTQLSVEEGEGVWKVGVVNAEGEVEHMFDTADGVTGVSEVLGMEGEQEIDLTIIGTQITGGYEKLYSGVEPGEGHYMWRYPWGGWVRNELQTFEENGVGIIANEAQLYGGLLTINPEQIEETWRNFVEGVYFVNQGSENKEFLSQYPTVESFVEAAAQGTIFESLRILAPHTNKQEFAGIYGATWEVKENVDLTFIEFALSHKSEELMRSYSARGFSGINYYGVMGLTASISSQLVNENTQLRFAFAKHSINDDIVDEWGIGPGVSLGLQPNGPTELIAKSLTQDVRVFFDEMRTVGDGETFSGRLIYWLDFIDGPPLFRLVFDHSDNPEVWLEFQELENSPIKLLQ